MLLPSPVLPGVPAPSRHHPWRDQHTLGRTAVIPRAGSTMDGDAAHPR